MTVLFYALSVEIAQRLLDAGAHIDVVDNESRACVQWHLQVGHSDIADMLVAHGGKREPHWQLGQSAAKIEENEREILWEKLRRTNRQELEDLKIARAVDYGCILPVRSIAIQPVR
jgi:hypothetical protein